MSTSGCKSSLGCADTRVPARATYVNLYKWPESDAEFVKTMARGGRAEEYNDGTGRRKWKAAAPAVVDGYSCRQMYLRSYKFSRDEEDSVAEKKTLRCFTGFPCLQEKNESSGSVNGDANGKQSAHKSQRRRWRKNNKKACVTAMKLREISCNTLHFIFHRLLSRTA